MYIVLLTLLIGVPLVAVYCALFDIMLFSTLAIFGAIAAQAVAVPFQNSRVVHERRDLVPKAWVKRNRLEPSAELPVRIGMTQRNLDKGHDLLMEV